MIKILIAIEALVFQASALLISLRKAKKIVVRAFNIYDIQFQIGRNFENALKKFKISEPNF